MVMTLFIGENWATKLSLSFHSYTNFLMFSKKIFNLMHITHENILHNTYVFKGKTIVIYVLPYVYFSVTEYKKEEYTEDEY